MNIINLFTVGILFLGFLSCQTPKKSEPETLESEIFMVVLGVAQDAGYPQIGCEKSCCVQAWDQSRERVMVSSLGIVDLQQGAHWIIDATPDLKDQWRYLSQRWGTELRGIFITHAHIGHYTGLMQLGREALGGRQIPVYVMPRMHGFLESNGPWNQLVDLENIALQRLQADSTVYLGNQLAITPVLVPHRDEYSETVGYDIQGPNYNTLFIPDIDKWELWHRDILQETRRVDRAFVDGSFFQDGELPGRDMSEIPHPFVQETMKILESLAATDKSKVHFIHFNHTNPLLRAQTEARATVSAQGFQLAEQGKAYPL